MLLLVFPKQFEFALFLDACYKAHRVSNCSPVFPLNDAYLLTWAAQSETEHVEEKVLVMIAKESDIGFYSVMRTRFRELQVFVQQSGVNVDLFFNNLIVLNCGTCGGSRMSQIGNAYFILQALKYDRGKARIESVAQDEKKKKNLVVSIDKCETSCDPCWKFWDYTKDPQTAIQTAITLSGNFLFASSPTELYQITQLKNDEDEQPAEDKEGKSNTDGQSEGEKKSNTDGQSEGEKKSNTDGQSAEDKERKIPEIVAEMETYEFFKICTEIGLGAFAAFRVVSDADGKTEDVLKCREGDHGYDDSRLALKPDDGASSDTVYFEKLKEAAEASCKRLNFLDFLHKDDAFKKNEKLKNYAAKDPSMAWSWTELIDELNKEDCKKLWRKTLDMSELVAIVDKAFAKTRHFAFAQHATIFHEQGQHLEFVLQANERLIKDAVIGILHHNKKPDSDSASARSGLQHHAATGSKCWLIENPSRFDLPRRRLLQNFLHYDL